MKCKRIMCILLALCLMLGVMVIPAIAKGNYVDFSFVEGTTIKVESFADASGYSGNDNFRAHNFLIDDSGVVYLLMDAKMNGAKAPKMITVTVNGKELPSVLGGT